MKYKVITLCGSTRFKDAFIEAQKWLTLEGNIVISVAFFSQTDDVLENMTETEITEKISMLNEMHRQKIDMADEIYVINVGGYIGKSTLSEIEYAKSIAKRYVTWKRHSSAICAYSAFIYDFKFDSFYNRYYNGTINIRTNPMEDNNSINVVADNLEDFLTKIYNHEEI